MLYAKIHQVMVSLLIGLYVCMLCDNRNLPSRVWSSLHTYRSLFDYLYKLAEILAKSIRLQGYLHASSLSLFSALPFCNRHHQNPAYSSRHQNKYTSRFSVSEFEPASLTFLICAGYKSNFHNRIVWTSCKMADQSIC